VLTARALRGFADGFVSVYLARYLALIGYSKVAVGAVVTATLVGSALLTLIVGLAGSRYPLRTLLLAASVLMLVTSAGFIGFTQLWLVLVVAVVGTMNPSAGDVSVFLPTEQAYLADHSTAAGRPPLYAVYNVVGTLAGALGALASAAPEPVGHSLGWSASTSLRAGFGIYGVVAVAVFVLYRRLPHEPRPERATGRTRAPLGDSRRMVFELSALFSLDSAGSGLVVQALLVLWLHERFDLSRGATAGVFFAAGLLGGASQLLAGPLAARIGLIRTMAFTHLPANLLLVVAAFAPNATLAVVLLLARSLFSQMDSPARQSFVMAVVAPEDRAAAASVTNVPRSLASAATPLAAGALLSVSKFGWPLVIAGATKGLYDIILLVMYRDVAEESGARRGGRPSSTDGGAR
jgi:MFS family permease